MNNRISPEKLGRCPMPENPVVCISCVKSKRSHACAAKDMYTSPLFQGMLAYARKLQSKRIFILSAKYGLLNLDEVIEPYEKTLRNMKGPEKKAWAEDILAKLRHETDLQEDRFVFLAGMPYRENLLPHIKYYEVPMEGMPFGRQLQWLGEQSA
jgi:hypothetical protein